MAGVSSVLARKYRSQTFADLIGQEALVRTLTNAIENNKLASAYILTGIRGIGKTSSARIIAKGLNCVGPDGKGGMTPNPCGICEHCRQIANDSHMDVIEIDAASNTGVDNAREIIESAKYNPVTARFKIFIIDEVHMLSKAAFNALLKTLEEPPERIKFIFATTEIRKVPITILSRCQRFDLKRVDVPTLTAHLKNIVAKENATADEDALKMIAQMGEGSVRDSLSLLDQALVRFDGNLTAEKVAQMVGLADKGILFDLYEAMMAGNTERVFEILAQQDSLGVDVFALATDLLNLTHWLTRVKIIPSALTETLLSKEDLQRGKALADSLSLAALTAVWQMLLKGLQELKMADNPVKAFEMLLVRLLYRAQLPDLTKMPVMADEKKNS